MQLVELRNSNIVLQFKNALENKLEEWLGHDTSLEAIRTEK